MSPKPAAAHFTDTLTSSPDAPRAPLNCYAAVTALTMALLHRFVSIPYA
jgi:hypothetical protein